MKCKFCGRELQQDSQFCDICGNRAVEENHDNVKMGFNKHALIMGILISVLITIAITGFAKAFGLPLLFGGLFLPFFWNIKKNSKS